jgi:NAD(P)-dependent dehydrogenase (short-subunit alcohol dehydrogenase family)
MEESKVEDNSGKGILIFGGARGIGGETAKYFSERGWNVIAADVLDKELGELAQSAKNIKTVHCDVAKVEDIQNAYKFAEKELPRLNGVFNNVGIARYGTVDKLSLEDWEYTLRVNLTAQYISASLAVPIFKRNGSGSIVNTASVLGHMNQKTTAAYSASKAGVMALSRAIAVDHALDGIRCNSISPGTIDTPLLKIVAEDILGRTTEEVAKEWAEYHPVRRLGRPEEVAALVYFLINDELGFITGTDIKIDGGSSVQLFR